MRQTAALYPFCSELLPVVRALGRGHGDYMLTELLAPPGLGLAGHDAGHASNHPTVGITVTDDIDVATSAWETLLVFRTVTTIIDTDSLVSVASRVLAAGKNVHWFGVNGDDEEDSLYALLETFPEQMHIVFRNKVDETEFGLFDDFTKLTTPVILIGGLVTQADTCEVMFRLKEQLITKGYHPSLVSRYPMGRLFGCSMLDHIFCDGFLTEAQKITRLNLLLRTIEFSERPDIILVEAPDALMRYSDLAVNGYGIQSYMLSQAIQPDYLVCCVPFELAESGFLAALSTDFHGRLGASICAVHVSNIIVDSFAVMQSHEISYVHTKMERVVDHIRASEMTSPIIPLSNVLYDDARSICEALFSSLEA